MGSVKLDAVSLPSLVMAGSVTGIRDGMTITAAVGELVPVETAEDELKELPAVDRPSKSLPESRSLGMFVTVELTVDQIIAGSGLKVSRRAATFPERSATVEARFRKASP